MGEKINFVISFTMSDFAEADVSSITSRLALRILGADARRWTSIHLGRHVNGDWPLTREALRQRLIRGEVIAVYPREDDSSADGVIVWSSGSRIATSTVAVPAERAPEMVRQDYAVVALEETYPYGAALCAVGSELELDDDDEDVRADALLKRPEVELIALMSSAGTPEVKVRPRGHSS